MEEEEIRDLYQKGIAAYRRGEYQTAGDLLMEVVEASDQDHRAWNALGVAFTKSTRYEDADICFENALTLDPGNEVYQRNREKNARNLKKDYKAYFSQEVIPLVLSYDKRYIVGGVIGIIVLLALLVFVLLPMLAPAPLSESAGEIPIQIEMDEDFVLITNTGGPGTASVRFFTVTGNNQTLFGPDGRTLAPAPNSFLAIPLDTVRRTADNDAVTIRVNAYFPDDTSRLVATQELSLPPIVVITPEPTPEPVLYTPLYKTGDVLLVSDTGAYVLISDLLAENEYQVHPLTRQNSGLFVITGGSGNVSMQEYDSGAKKAASLVNPGDAEFLPGVSYPAVRTSSAQTPLPLYVPGDLVSRSQGTQHDGLIILGYDEATDEYATDILTRYPSGEWGYRSQKEAIWRLRTEIERLYPSRISRIALSQVGIGADSSPPGTLPRYAEGDIVATDRGADAEQLVIIVYHPGTNSYDTDMIRRSYDGMWYRSGTNTSVTRPVLEQDYPYLVRNIDLSLVQSG